MFVDEVEIHVAAGHGGKGALSFRREKFVPRGGPDGGDGGPGGNVYLVAHANLNTLLNFRFQKIFEAGNGASGAGSIRTGKSGADITLQVPIGTQVFEKQRGRCGVTRSSRTSPRTASAILIAKGGLGGQGNARYATSTNRAPRRTQPGLPGEEKDLRLQLKLLADVGIVGYPNAGKSTIISRISAAKPKIADYPFTTLVPNLGVVGLSGDRSFVVADVPGLIEGAHEGHGLGHRFLSHLERTRVLVHVVDVSSIDGARSGRGLRDRSRASWRSSPDATRRASGCRTSRSWWRRTRSTRSTIRSGCEQLREHLQRRRHSALPCVGGDGRRPAAAARSGLEETGGASATHGHHADRT